MAYSLLTSGLPRLKYLANNLKIVSELNIDKAMLGNKKGA